VPKSQAMLRKLSGGLIAAAVIALGAGSADAAFPGSNGKIIFSRCDDAPCNTAHLWTIDPSGTNLAKAVNPLNPALVPESADDPAYSPSARSVAFRNCPTAGSCLIDVWGPNPQHSPNNGASSSDDFPAFSPDGTAIAWQRCPVSGPCAIWISSPSSVQLTHPATLETDSAPVFSPDGSKIVYQHCPNGAGCEIDVVNTDGSGGKSLTTRPSGADDDAPSFSPDGTRIVFHRCCDGNGRSQIFLMGADGSSPTPLTTPDANSNDAEPAFSPDGTQVVFERAAAATGIGKISTVPVTGGVVTPLTDGGVGGDYRADWQPGPPVISSAPRITGSLVTGAVLTAVPSGAIGGGTASFGWFRCDPHGQHCVVMGLGATFTPGSSEIGQTIKLRQTQTNAVGKVTADSTLSAPVVATKKACTNFFVALFNKSARGSSGGDLMYGNVGHERLYGGAGRDCIRGQAGNDHIYGGGGDDKLWGGAGSDLIAGGSGNDTIYGESGNDRINPGPGRNTVSGGAGNDVINAANRSRDTVNCGRGSDKATADPTDKLRGCERVKLVGRQHRRR
jgi:RTX calcium-binding nonapeptide repeat (4 copies)/WD40-like Beta Propeller Repeat